MDLLEDKDINIVNNYKYKIYLNSNHNDLQYAIRKDIEGIEKNHFFYNK